VNTGVVTQHLISLITKQVNDNGLVVWYDPVADYSEVIDFLELPDTTVIRYDRSYISLRREIDQKKLMDGERPPRMVVYIPMLQEQTHHALIELEVAGVVMQPGQQPPTRNTRLAVVARNALKDVLGEENVTRVEKQTEAGKLTLADLNALADKGGEISKSVLTLIFGSGTSQEIVLCFLDRGQFDESITSKGAKGELLDLLRQDFNFDVTDDIELGDLRQRLARHVLLTDLIAGLGDSIPPKLVSVPVATSLIGKDACTALARVWRSRRDTRDSYVNTASKVESEYDLTTLKFNSTIIEDIETFLVIEENLLHRTEDRLLERTDSEILTLAKSRLSCFWCDVEPSLQARWALVSSVAEVLLEADRVEQALKKAFLSTTSVIKEYTEGDEPWCLLDTYHRHMESHWYNYEPRGDDHDSIERLVIRARQRYVEIGSEVAKCFLSLLEKNLPEKVILHQYEVFEKYIKPSLGKEKIAYVWVDALRFEMGRELARLFKEDFEVNLQTAFAAVPTVTEIGMAALLPSTNTYAIVVTEGNGKLALEINGVTIRDRKDRVAFLNKHAGVQVFDAHLDHLLPKPSKKVREGIANAELILVTSQEIDELCEKGNITQARRQMDGVLNDLRRGLRVLFDLGIHRIILAADHGHIFGEELSEDMKIDAPGGDTVDLHRRVWVGHGGKADDAYLRAPINTLGMKGEFDLATPWTFACFKCKGGAKAYFHGGLSPQEVLVPVMALTPSAKPPTALPVGIEWELIPGSQKLTTRFFSVQITGRNKGLFDVVPPKVRVELRTKGRTISQAVSASYGFEESTGDVDLRNDEVNTKKIVPNTVTLMVVEEPDQNNVGLFLLDAATGAELARLEKIEVAISM